MSDKKNILVVEDEAVLQKAIVTKLKLSGFDTLSAKSVEEATEHLQSGKVDAIWLDHYLMGDENGLDFVVKLKTDDSQFKSIPIFVVSNTATQDKVRSYLNLGVNNYYTKSDNSMEKIISDIKLLFV